ncbi:MAG: TonB family protein [Janthinobacterium lividum]
MKRWLCVLVLSTAVFIGIKEASAQKRTRKDTINSLNIIDPGPKDHKDGIGEDTYTEYQIPAHQPIAHEPYSWTKVEVLPAFPGGKEAYESYFRRKIKTAPLANNSRVIVSFIVEKNGSLTNMEILEGLNTKADKKALKILKKSPKWVPGMQAGKAVRVNYVMPIKFYN